MRAGRVVVHLVLQTQGTSLVWRHSPSLRRCLGVPVQLERRCRAPTAAREAHQQVLGSSNSLAELNNVISC